MSGRRKSTSGYVADAEMSARGFGSGVCSKGKKRGETVPCVWVNVLTKLDADFKSNTDIVFADWWSGPTRAVL